MMHVAFPFSIEVHGRVAEVDRETYVRQMIEQVLFTSPGERVNRPTFGCDLRGLVFEEASSEYFAAAGSVLQGTLQQWLGDVIVVESVHVQPVENAVTIEVSYVDRETSKRFATAVRFGG